MKVLVDENIPLMTVEALRKMGHDVHDVRATKGKGMLDASLRKLAQREQRLVITTDKYFIRHRDEDHCGLLIVRLRQPNRKKIHLRVMQALSQLSSEKWLGLSVVMRDVVQVVSRTRGPG
ncbi:MAG TPA: DUF5615 family PIN-like protein [Acidobacteriota bacterium]|jgi:predicted nuclease of predicted toxin-antitoxin system|nr:DUF5615 family PIN-like protein [Acidobacteriota bacterium]